VFLDDREIDRDLVAFARFATLLGLDPWAAALLQPFDHFRDLRLVDRGVGRVNPHGRVIAGIDLGVNGNGYVEFERFSGDDFDFRIADWNDFLLEQRFSIEVVHELAVGFFDENLPAEHALEDVPWRLAFAKSRKLDLAGNAAVRSLHRIAEFGILCG